MATSHDQLPLPIIDSHIHLYPSSEVDTLAWATPNHPLYGQRSVADFKAATKANRPSLLGFVLVESDRRHDLTKCGGGGGGNDDDKDKDNNSGWEAPLQEVRWMSRVALGQPRDGSEGHDADDARLCLALVPWAPLPRGPDVLATYLDRVRDAAADAWPKVRGFRYLLQDKPHGTMLQQPFIDGLKLLGRRGFVFEVAVDHHRRGRKQLHELIELVDRAHDGVAEEEKVKFIVNHLCKPDLSIYNLATDPSFLAWRTTIYALGKVPQVYMKLSGAFSEMPASLRRQDPAHIFQSTFGWLGVVLATFGARRIMFGSDWPICTVVEMPDDKNGNGNGNGNDNDKDSNDKDEKIGDDHGKHEDDGKNDDDDDDAWPRWKEVVDKMCWMASLTDDERAMIYGGTAKEAYGF